MRQNSLVAAHMLCSDVTGATVRVEACGGRDHLLRILMGCAGAEEKATALDLTLALPGGRYKAAPHTAPARSYWSPIGVHSID